MAWRRPGDKPLSEPMMFSLPTQICVTRSQWVKNQETGIRFIGVWGVVCTVTCKGVVFWWCLGNTIMNVSTKFEINPLSGLSGNAHGRTDGHRHAHSYSRCREAKIYFGYRSEEFTRIGGHFADIVQRTLHSLWGGFVHPHDDGWNPRTQVLCRGHPADTLRDNDVVITSKLRHIDVITSKWGRFNVTMTLLLRHVVRGQFYPKKTQQAPYSSPVRPNYVIFFIYSQLSHSTFLAQLSTMSCYTGPSR